jgi:single-strand DNA-binding protein
MNNQSIIKGHLAQDPEYKSLNSGRAVTRFTVAVNTSFRSGNKVTPHTDWIQVEAWGYLALPASRLAKGDAVSVVGPLRSDKYVKENVTHYTTTLSANDFDKLDKSIFTSADLPANEVQTDGRESEALAY